MNAVIAFLGMLLTSIVVALLVALQLGDFFRAEDELRLVLAGVAVFAVFAFAIFMIIYKWAGGPRALNSAGWLLAAIACAPLVMPGLIQKIAAYSGNPYIEDLSIRFELVLPAVIAVLVQWGLMRRRWLRTAGKDELMRWPWITTLVAGIAILNPIGLAFLQATLKHSATDWLWQFTASVTTCVLAALLVMALVECYIRGRILRRRSGRVELQEARAEQS